MLKRFLIFLLCIALFTGCIFHVCYVQHTFRTLNDLLDRLENRENKFSVLYDTWVHHQPILKLFIKQGHLEEVSLLMHSLSVQIAVQDSAAAAETISLLRYHLQKLPRSSILTLHNLL